MASISQGAAGLVNVKLPNDGFLVQGKEVAAATNEEEDAMGLTGDLPYPLETRLVERGAQFSGGHPLEPHVVISGRLVTGQNTASAPGVALAVARLLAGKEGNQANR